MVHFYTNFDGRRIAAVGDNTGHAGSRFFEAHFGLGAVSVTLPDGESERAMRAALDAEGVTYTVRD